MYACVNVCVYVRVCVCAYVCVYVCVYVCMMVCIYTCGGVRGMLVDGLISYLRACVFLTLVTSTLHSSVRGQ